MCGILVYKKKGNNSFIQRRGDVVNSVLYEGFNFVHTLLPINGFIKQPYLENGIAMLYNGEVYNLPYKKSDGENIIPLYQKYDKDFTKYLDGEYAIALYDFRKKKAVFATDPFGTKPLFRRGVECASYRSGVGGERLEPNTVSIVNLDTGKEECRQTTKEWNWNQFKDTYDDWVSAFESSVRKRAVERCFIGLSSGYDSGAINYALMKIGKRFKAFSINNNENTEIIQKRGAVSYEYDQCPVDFQRLKEKLNDIVEPEKYHFSQENLIREDIASVGLAAICERAKNEGRKVILSGQGADEIIGDYRLYPKQSNFKGIFPKELKKWENFDGGFNSDYINKEEYIGGAFGIETRYPFLDTEVVQEFLNLSQTLKNAYYKAPIREYLIRYHIPFEEGVKHGFRPI
jgi:asparagine synthetase B (glutamine-hydrolysing)